MSMFTLVISSLTTSNMPWFMDLTIQVPRQSESYAVYTVLNLASITSPTHNWVLSLLWPHPFILSGVISPLISSIILGIYWPGGFIFSVLSFCLSYCSWGSQDKSIEVVCHSLLQWTTFFQNSPPWPICLEWPYTAWLIVSLSEARLWSMW